MAKAKKTPEEIKNFMQKYSLSVRKLAVLLSVNPSSVVHWQNKRNAIGEKNADLLDVLEQKVQAISENDSLSYEQVLDILTALAKTPIWKGIESIPSSFVPNRGLSLDVDLINAAKDDLDKIEKGLRIGEGAVRRIGGFDIACKDSQGRATLIEIKIGTVDVGTLGELVARMADARDVAGKDFRVIVLAHGFSPEFVRAATQIPALTLKRFSVKATFKTTDVQNS